MALRDITTVTQFIQEVSIMLDLGKSYSLSEVEKHIENKDVIDWLEKEVTIRQNRSARKACA
jgi:hypothetical protein